MILHKILIIFLALLLWSMIGFLIAIISHLIDPSHDDFRYVNPIWIYYNCKVNIFGVFFLTIIFNILCPFGSICYWIYKLCTIGRK